MSLSFRLCRHTPADKHAVVEFLDANWGERHPLVHCDDFFRHYYVDERRNLLQFAFACEDDVPVALAGYIRANDFEQPDIWVSIWCAVKGKNGVGLELMAALPELAHARMMACNNIRPKTMPFYTFLGYTAARVPHYYRIADRTTYAVARITDKTILPAGGNAVLTPLTQEMILRDYIPNTASTPCKDAWYLVRRYCAYPRRQYLLHGVYDGTQLASILVTYVVSVNDTHVLRIVDYIGAPAQFASLGNAIDALMRACNAEYADCYCYGIAPEIFAAAGFCERHADSHNIIPNYLAPPLYENTEYYCFTSSTDGFTLWKADGDQDRPYVEL